MAKQKWRVAVKGQEVNVSPPIRQQASLPDEKAITQRQELIKRDQQLSLPSVRKFIQSMEVGRRCGGQFVSIFSLMRDGRELSAALRRVRNVLGEARAQLLGEIVDPYLQVVTSDARCEFTGLRLQDIWRYFRHTWTNQYTSVPGRTMALLVRDRAAPMHPVVGILALGSPIVQIRKRDMWIGWHHKAFLKSLRESPHPEAGAWLRQILQAAVAEIYVEDLFEEKVITPDELHDPSPETLVRLTEFGNEERRNHHRFTQSKDHKKGGRRAQDQDGICQWVERARSHLFRSKRALTLSELLRARRAIERLLSRAPTENEVLALLKDPEGRKAIITVLRKAKADRVGIAMADITVCGAVAPYNHILGGKLAAMLAASPEVVDVYRTRYGETQSEIASSMAGRPIKRPADLVLLGTTSLYGGGLNQYSRVRIPAERVGGKPGEAVRYIRLGHSNAYGTSQYSEETIKALVTLVQQSSQGQRVNSIFGEGVSPKLRKVRDGLGQLNLPADDLLQHGRRRLAYGVPLVRNVREYLIGKDDKPDYIFSLWGKEATAAIVDWWRERWLSRRIDSERVLQSVAQHTLIRPIRHGARVVVPPQDPDQGTLFDDIEQ